MKLVVALMELAAQCLVVHAVQMHRYVTPQLAAVPQGASSLGEGRNVTVFQVRVYFLFWSLLQFYLKFFIILRLAVGFFL